jgi:hypothetical protein
MSEWISATQGGDAKWWQMFAGVVFQKPAEHVVIGAIDAHGNKCFP